MAKLKHLDHEIFLDKKHRFKAQKWCMQHFGERWDLIDNREGRWTVFWAGPRSANPGQYRWCFADEKDAMLFALKWS